MVHCNARMHPCTHASRQNIKLEVNNDRSEPLIIISIPNSYSSLNFTFLDFFCYFFEWGENCHYWMIQNH
jgi:hypothetical protein